MNLREQFEKETGKNWQNTGTDGVHKVLITVPNPEYVEWLEKRNKEQVEVLENARLAIYNAEDEAFGLGELEIDNKLIKYPIKDEILNQIEEQLKKSE